MRTARTRARRSGVALSLTLSLALGPVVATIDSAQAATSGYQAKAKQVALSNPQDLIATNDKIYVSDGNAVNVYSAATDALITSVTGVFGATSLALSPDGSEVLVTANDGSNITAISTSTDAVLATGSTASCPRSLAVTASTVWYVGDCTAPYHLYTLPLDSLTATATAVPGVTTDSTDRTTILVDGSTLVVAQDAAVDVYSIASDDSLSAATSVAVDADTLTGPDMALHGTSLYVRSNSTAAIKRYNVATGNVTGSYSPGVTPIGIAVSADGALVGAAADEWYDDDMYVWNEATGTQLVGAALLSSGSAHAGAWLSAFSPDGTRLFALGKYWTGTSAGYEYYLGTSTTSAPAKITAKLTLHAPAKVGGKLLATTTVSAHGSPVGHVPVRLTWYSNGVTKIFHATTGANGVAKASIPIKYSGTVQAYVAGALTTLPAASATVSYKAPSSLTVAMSSALRVTHGVRMYSSYKSVHAAAKLSPKRAYVSVKASLQRRVGRAWRTVQSIDLSTSATSLVAVKLYAASPGYVLRFRFSFAGDSFNKGSSKASAPFAVLH